MSDITRDDLWKITTTEGRPVTDEEFDRLAGEAGYVKVDDHTTVTTIYVETSGEALTRSLYLGPTDEKAIPVGTYLLVRLEAEDE